MTDASRRMLFFRLGALAAMIYLFLVFQPMSGCPSKISGTIALRHARVVTATGNEQVFDAIVIADGKIAAATLLPAPAPRKARDVETRGLYVAAMTFDRSAKTIVDGIRHVWVGQMNVGDPGDVLLLRSNPGRVRPGYLPDTDAIVAAIVDGVYYSARDLNRPR